MQGLPAATPRKDKRAEGWNRLYKPGTKVIAHLDHKTHIETRTKGEAFKINHGFAAVQVQYGNLYFFLSDIKPIEPPNQEPG